MFRIRFRICSHGMLRRLRWLVLPGLLRSVRAGIRGRRSGCPCPRMRAPLSTRMSVCIGPYIRFRLVRILSCIVRLPGTCLRSLSGIPRVVLLVFSLECISYFPPLCFCNHTIFFIVYKCFYPPNANILILL